MEFKVFAKKLKKAIGAGSNTSKFTKTIFEEMMDESGPDQLAGYKAGTFKSFFNGYAEITVISSIVLAHLNEEEGFSSYLDTLGDTAAQCIADQFSDDIPGIYACNASEKIEELFLEILKEAAGKEKSTPKSAMKDENKTPENTLNDKLIASAQVIADVWAKSVSHLGDSSSNKSDKLVLPSENTIEELPYSDEDKTLLEEFTSDYDEIMVTLIGENYAASLIDMSIPNKVNELYSTKWHSKADAFCDPTLKSYIFALLGELNNLAQSFFEDDNAEVSIRHTRLKIRNLYVKLHPSSYGGSTSYDAFIDDWDDGEY